MFDKTIKVSIDGNDWVFTNEEVVRMWRQLDNKSKLSERLGKAEADNDRLRARLDEANAKLKEYGHVSGF